MTLAELLGGIAAGLLIAAPVFGLIVWLWYMEERYWK